MVFEPLKQFPIKLTTPFGNVVQAEYDPRLARPISLTDSGGAVQRSVYDQLSRVAASIAPGDSSALPTETYRYVITSLPIEIARSARAISGAAGTIDTRHFLDGAGRVLEERARDEAGEVSSASFLYGARGLLARRFSEQRATTPGYTPPEGGRPALAVSYDAVGREGRDA